MNQKVRTVLIAVLIFVVLGSAWLLYQKLSVPYAQTPAAQSASGGAESADAEPAADFTVYDADGKEVSLSDFAGKPVVVNFWASWCGYCKVEMPHFQKAYETYGEDIQFLMVDLSGGGSDTKEAADQVITEGGYTFPVYYDNDSSAAYAYSVRSIPLSLFLDKDGSLVSQHLGALSAEDLDALLQQIQ